MPFILPLYTTSLHIVNFEIVKWPFHLLCVPHAQFYAKYKLWLNYVAHFDISFDVWRTRKTFVENIVCHNWHHKLNPVNILKRKENQEFILSFGRERPNRRTHLRIKTENFFRHRLSSQLKKQWRLFRIYSLTDTSTSTSHHTVTHPSQICQKMYFFFFD